MTPTQVPTTTHYSGDIIAVDFRAPQDAVASLLPTGLRPLEGRGSVVFADWCSSSDDDGRVLADPAIGQYREAYVVLHALRDDGKVGRVPVIWVDREPSPSRGRIQGPSKKLGQIAMTRPIELGSGGFRREPGARFAAHASSEGRRVISAQVQLERTRLHLPRAVTLPLVHAGLFPAIDRPEPAVHALACGRFGGLDYGAIYTGAAQLGFGDTECEQLAQLGPTEVRDGYSFSMCFSVLGGEVEPA